MESFEVGIIGAGIHGVSVALNLGSQAVKTVLFERDTPAAGPTGRSSAVCRAFYTNQFLATVAREGIELLRHFDEVSGGRSAGYVDTGMLYLHPEEDAKDLRLAVERLSALGIGAETIEVDDLPGLYPFLATDGVGLAAWEPDAGYADPAATTIGLFERAVELGVTPRLGHGVVGLEPRPGGGAIVVADDGSRTECERVLIAAGPWTLPLAQSIGVELPLTAERHYVATFGWGGGPEIPFGFADLIAKFYCKPEGEDLFCLGPLTEEPIVPADDYAQEVSDEETGDLGERLVGRVPDLASADSRGGWASLYDVSPDWMPVIGEIADGIFVDAGTSGHGFKLAPALGRHIADLVTGKPADPALDQFSPERFDRGQLLRGGYGDIRILG